MKNHNTQRTATTNNEQLKNEEYPQAFSSLVIQARLHNINSQLGQLNNMFYNAILSLDEKISEVEQNAKNDLHNMPPKNKIIAGAGSAIAAAPLLPIVSVLAFSLLNTRNTISSAADAIRSKKNNLENQQFNAQFGRSA